MKTLIRNAWLKAHHTLHSRYLARNAIELMRELDISPITLIDCGANNSQFARPIKSEFPVLRVVSFEPNQDYFPIGEIRREALGDVRCEVRFDPSGAQGRVDPDGNMKVQVVRLDEELPSIAPIKPMILKVDCESSTIHAVRGAGTWLSNFDLVVCEVWNHPAVSTAYLDWSIELSKIMLDSGFRHSRLLDCSPVFGTTTTYDIGFWK